MSAFYALLLIPVAGLLASLLGISIIAWMLAQRDLDQEPLEW